MAGRAQFEEVNIDFGDDMSRMFDVAARATYNNIPGAIWRADDSFRSFRGIDGQLYAHQAADTVVNLGFDGIGTKVEIRERMQTTHGKEASHVGSAFDLGAMVKDDALRSGSQVVAWGSVLDTGKLDPNDPQTVEGMRELSAGMVMVSRAAGTIAINGEIAELIGRVRGYGRFNYNWGAGVLTLTHKSRVLSGKTLQPGNKLVGIPEFGIRCNGATDIRGALKQEYGINWHTKVEASLGSLTLGQLVQIPATIYHGVVTELTGGWDIRNEPKARITGFAHITGGGQPSKLNTMLGDSGLGITIDDPIEPPAIFGLVQEIAGFSDEKTYKKFHMGPGGVIATSEPAKVLAHLHESGLEGSKIIGEITDEPGIRIKNRGALQDKEWLEFQEAA